ncbi:hypothetical protein AUK10_03410 [Candidatus Gracilibacteria bacterium CG2_30_37_12]|nr:MAG: hypothetical protein AUK10_03410 [Candidatus Gracilibacteria bacterium CG2_30_37_12]
MLFTEINYTSDSSLPYSKFPHMYLSAQYDAHSSKLSEKLTFYSEKYELTLADWRELREKKTPQTHGMGTPARKYSLPSSGLLRRIRKGKDYILQSYMGIPRSLFRGTTSEQRFDQMIAGKWRILDRILYPTR